MIDRRVLSGTLSGVAVWLMLCTAAIATPPSVLQRGYGTNVINANTAETILTTSNVNETTFGRVFSLPVDGRMYAQPLYVPGVAIPNQGTHNVLYVATMTNSIFAFDADSPGAPLWSVNYAALLGTSAVPIVDFVGTDSLNIAGPAGIESTPVIDPTTQTMYFVTNTLESGLIVFRLHAVDITTGAEKFGGSVVISGTVTAGGKTVTFTPSLENQRVSLTIAKNQVVIGFGSHEDYYQYYGWLMSYNKTTLAQTGVFNPVPTADHGGGVWQSGLPPAVDSSGYVYAFVGNSWPASGSTSAFDGVNDFTESAVKLDPGNGLKLVDYFTPGNYQALDNGDLDLSSNGPLLIPNTTSMIVGGKDGNVYLVNSQNMGKMTATNTGALQSFQGTTGNIRGGVAYWPRSTTAGGPLAYIWGSGDSLKAYSFTGTSFNTPPVATYTPAVNLYPGGEVAVSSNGDNQGILWALINVQGDANHRIPPGALVAVNAATLSPLWNSTSNVPRDDFGLYAKWVPPVIVNGKVYMATSSNQVAVYGLLPTNGTVTAWPLSQAALGGSASFVVNALSAAGTAQTATWSVSALPTGASGSFSTDGQGQTVLQVTAGATTPSGNAVILVTATVNGTQTTQPLMVNFVPATLAAPAAATADSYYASNPPSYAIDGNTATFWSTLYGTTVPNYPHELTVDLGSVQSVYGLTYLTRQDGCSNGMMLQYSVEVSPDNVNYSEVTGGSFDYGPQWHNFNCSGGAFFLPKRQTVTFPATPARYVQLTGLGSATNVDPWATAAEVQVFTGAGTATPIVPYVAVSGVWTEETSATVSPGTAVNLGPQPVSGGSWSWQGPSGFTSTSREIDNIPLSTGANVYVATYTNVEGITSTATFTITVTASASFTLSPTASALTLLQGASGMDGIGVTAANGFSGSVGFAVGPLPAGVSASFTPTSSTSSSTLSLVASATATVGASTVTVTGTSGALTAMTTIALKVNAAPLAQTISFAALAAQTVGTPLTLSASASSGLTVSFAATPASVCTLSGTTVTFVAPGNCTLVASQAGNASYVAATPVSQTVAVSSAPVASFVLGESPGTLSIAQGQSGGAAIAVSAVNGFTGTVSFSASGLPAGVTASFSPTSSTTSSMLNLSASATATTGTSTVTITGTSGTLTSSASVVLTVSAASSGGSGSATSTVTSVSLSSVDNLDAIAKSGTSVSGIGGDGYAYASALLPGTVTYAGASFTLGAANALDAVTSKTIALPSGSFSTLRLLGAAIYGAQLNQAFVVTYTDGSTTTFTQSLSDWGSPQSFTGETVASSMTYRIIPSGATQNGPWDLYGYSFTLNPAKTVKSLTLPSDTHVIVFGVDLIGSVTSVSLSSVDNLDAIAKSGTSVSGIGGDGYAYASALLPGTVTYAGASFTLGAANVLDAVTSKTIPLPSGTFNTLRLLGAGIYGAQLNQAFVVTYTDGSTTTFTQSLSDWGYPQSFTGETVASSMTYRIIPSGATQNGPWDLYGYSFTLNPAKTVKSLTLPNDVHVIVFGVDLM